MGDAVLAYSWGYGAARVFVCVGVLLSYAYILPCRVAHASRGWRGVYGRVRPARLPASRSHAGPRGCGRCPGAARSPLRGVVARVGAAGLPCRAIPGAASRLPRRLRVCAGYASARRLRVVMRVPAGGRQI